MNALTIDTATATKDELAEFALTAFDTKLDLRKSRDLLAEQVAKLLGEEKPKETKKAAKQPKGKSYLKHPKNGRVLEATPELLKRGDLLPCDEKGALIPADE